MRLSFFLFLLTAIASVAMGQHQSAVTTFREQAAQEHPLITFEIPETSN